MIARFMFFYKPGVTVAESEIHRMDLDDKVDTLRKAVCSKIKRLAKATGDEELYRAPDPRD